MRNLKKYSNHSGYSADERGLNYTVSICKSENHTHYDKPYDSKIAYLEIPVGAYIDSGIVPTNETGILYEYKRINGTNTSTTAVAGYRHSNLNATYFILQGYNSSSIGTWNATNRGVSIASFDAYQKCEFNYFNSRTFIVNNVQTTGADFEELSFTPTKSFYLGACRIANTDGLQSNVAPHQCFAAQVTQGSELVMNLIPVRVGTTGYMYDMVSKRLFGNSGTGEFTLGPDI